MTRRCARSSGIIALCMLLAMAFPAAARTTDQEPVVYPDEATLVVFDLSGSMNEEFSPGRTKLDEAKRALLDYVDTADPGGLFGLRVYGDQLPSAPAAQRQLNCLEDTRALVPVGRFDRRALRRAVRNADALGDTLITTALRAAANDFPDGALGRVLLISDGRDECHDADLDGDAASGPSWTDDPCRAAAELAEQDVDVESREITRIDTVGFNADRPAERQLRCIAEKTGGTFYDADDEDELARALQDATPRDVVRLGGAEVAGGTDRDSAPEIADGQTFRYTDTIEVGQERWYKASRYGPGRGNFTATVFGLPPREGLTLRLRFEGPNDENWTGVDRERANAGLPAAPSVSVRCPGCQWNSGEAVDTYWIVGLESEQPLDGRYDVELLLEDEAFGGPPVGIGGERSECARGERCWYEERIEDATQERDELTAERDDLLELVDAPPASPEQLDRRDALQAEVTELEEQIEVRSTTVAPNWTVLAALLVVLVVLWGVPLLTHQPARTAVARIGRSLPLADRRHTTRRRDGDPARPQGVIDLPDAPRAAHGFPVQDPPARSAGDADLRRPSEPAEQPQARRTEEPVEVPRRDPADGQEVPRDRFVDDATDVQGDAAADPGSEPTRQPASPAQGWYTDPTDDRRLRWWTGEAWSEHTREMP
jgi:hypothetical protein